MTQIGDDKLTQRALVTVSRTVIEDPRRRVGRDTPSSSIRRQRRSGPAAIAAPTAAATPQRDEVDLPVESIQVGIGRQFGVEDQFLGQLAGTLLPELTKPRISSFCWLLAQVAVGVAEDACVGVLGQKGENSLLSSAAFGDVVLLDQGVVTVKGDGVEIEVEGSAVRQTEPAHGVEPVAHQLGVASRDRCDNCTRSGTSVWG